MAKRPKVINVKASSAVVSRMLASAVGMGPVETINEFNEALREFDVDLSDNSELYSVLLPRIDALYTWTVDVGREIMGEGTDLQVALASDPGTLYVVNDSQRASKAGLWLAVADPAPQITNYVRRHCARGLFHTIEIAPGDTSHILAIQLISCLTN